MCLERRAIDRLRYEIYVEEMNFFQQQADHEQRLLTDANDEGARLLYVRDAAGAYAVTADVRVLCLDETTLKRSDAVRERIAA